MNSSTIRSTALVVGGGLAAAGAGWLAASAPLVLVLLVAAALAAWLVLGSDLRFLTIVLALRTLSDAAVLPSAVSTLINAGILALAVVLCIRLLMAGAKLKAYAAVLVGYLFFFTLRGIQVFGPDPTLITDTLRMLAVVAFAVAAGRLVVLHGSRRVAGAIILGISPAILISGLGWLLRVPTLYGTASGRGTGTFAHPVAAGGFFAIACILVLYSVLVHRRTEHLLVLGALGLATVGTVSLGTWLSVLAGCVFLLLLLPRGVRWRGRTVVLGAAAGFGLLLLVGAAVEERLTGLLSADDYEVSGGPTNSFAWRLRNWSALVDLWREHPLLGWGYGATSVNLKPLGESPHSGPVRILVESGIVGSAVVLGVLIFLVRTALRQRRAGDSAGSALRLAVVAVTVVNALSSNTMGYFPMLMLVTAAWAIGSPRTEPAARALPSAEDAAIGEPGRLRGARPLHRALARPV